MPRVFICRWSAADEMSEKAGREGEYTASKKGGPEKRALVVDMVGPIELTKDGDIDLDSCASIATDQKLTFSSLAVLDCASVGSLLFGRSAFRARFNST